MACARVHISTLARVWFERVGGRLERRAQPAPTVRSIDPGAREALLRELKALAARLAAELGADAVYLFGSLVRAEQHEGSDIDLLVVVPYGGRALDVIGEVLRRTDLTVEPLIVRPDGLARRLREDHPFFARIMHDSIRL